MLSEVLVWVFAIEALGFSAFFLLRPVLRSLPDSGLGVSKVLGVYGFGFLCWVLGVLGGVRLDRPLVLLLFFLVVGVGVFRAFTLVEEPLPRRRLLLAELAFLVAFIAFGIIRTFNPEIFWGEKPMDFTFLNFFIREGELPPQDPWAAGQRMHYYYLGTLVFSLLAKAFAVDPGVAYNLSIASVAGLFCAASFSFFSSVARNRWFAFLGAIAITFFANPEVLVLVFVRGHEINFDSFWASSRVFTSPAFIEYPSWSFLFADLHAHMIALPWTIALLTSGTLVARRQGDGARAPWPLILYGAVLGGLVPLNTWDFITYSVFTAVLLTATCLRSVVNGVAFRVAFPRVFVDGLIISAAALPFFAIFHATAMQPGVVWSGIVIEDFNTPDQFARLFGHWAVLLILAGTVQLARIRLMKGSDPFPGFLKGVGLCFAVSLVPFGFVVMRLLRRIGEIPWGISGIAAALASVGVLLIYLDRRKPASFFAGTALVTAGFLMVPAELHFLMDRMNTIFKVYNAVGTLLACATLALLPLVFTGLRSQRTSVMGVVLSSAVASVAALVLAVPTVAFVMNGVGIVKMSRTRTIRPALDGQAFLREENPDEQRLYQWLRKNVSGTPIMIEAFGNSYQQYTRVAMHTGIPTLLGWEHHVKQRGTRQEVVDRRRQDLRTIYGSTDTASTLRLLEAYGVDLVVVGNPERDAYGPTGPMKFERHPDLFPVLFRSGPVSIFATPGSTLNPKRRTLLQAKSVAQLEEMSNR